MHLTPRWFLIVATLTVLGSPSRLDASLAEFVAKPDPSYRWATGPSWQDGDVMFTSLRITSQTFQGTAWEHVLTVAYPNTIDATDHALLIVGGGRHDQLPEFGSPHGQTPASRLATLHSLATHSHLIVATIEQVPFQPLFAGLTEDAIISHSINQFFRTGDHTWPVLQPMVKSVVRAMDTLQAHVEKTRGYRLRSFTVSGESKRAWTSWLTAAIDPRVKAVVPLVFDMLNIPVQLQHQVATWGRYSEELGDYDGLAQMLASPPGQQLLEIIDPFRLRSHLNQAKLMILATNDRYWPVDAANFYFSDLPNPKYRYYVPNSGHETNGRPEIEEDRVAMALAAAGKITLPEVNSAFHVDPITGEGSLQFVSTQTPLRLRVMRATSKSLDFRSALWSEWMSMSQRSKATVIIDARKAQASAAYIEATYNLNGHRFTVTSEVGIIPAKPN